MDIAQSAGTIFDVRLQMEERIPILRMTRPGQLCQSSHQPLLLTLQQLRDGLGRQFSIEKRIARDEPMVHQRDGKLSILLVESLALRELASSGGDPYSGVPHLLIYPPDRIFHILLGQTSIEEKEQIDVGVRKQLRPAVSTDGHQGNARCKSAIALDLLRPKPARKL